MATEPFNDRGKCFICDEERIVYLCGGCSQKLCLNHLNDLCGGCSQKLCLNHLNEHRQQLAQQLNEIENDRDELLQCLIDEKDNRKKFSLMQSIDKWEVDSINKIQQTAEECRQLLNQHKNERILNMENKLTKLTEELKRIRKYNEFNEIDLNQLQVKLKELKDEVDQSQNIKIREELTPFVSKISVIVSSGK